MGHKVYVMLGFHINFYHSWRGDTPDEAGFGTDIRVIRGILDLLDAANAAGKQARGYWDSEVYWTFQEILPKHCPDILARMRARVTAGQDEIVLGPFNNGANHAATADEFRAAISWAIENPWGSGLRQLFPKVTPFYRSQEMMLTTGQEAILKECGVDGLMLYYALVPFNTLSSFTPALPLERRYNPFWYRSREDQPLLAVFPCMSAADVFELTSLEALLLDLHARQERGEIRSDVLVHLNEDADLETWLPLQLPSLLKWFPNTGGLAEYIQVVNKYPWADFTVPGEYLANHPPQGEVLVRQDLADGGFDGNYSWAEKYSSLQLWTLLERSRLASYRAEALSKRAGLDLRALLWDGADSSFFQRLIGLSTTHFGMSTPVINEERQARAFEILGKALQLAQQAERKAANALVSLRGAPQAFHRLDVDGQPVGRSRRADYDLTTKMSIDGAPGPSTTPGGVYAEKGRSAQGLFENNVLYEFELYPTPPAREAEAVPARVAAQVPLILPAGVESVALEADGEQVRAALTDRSPLPDGRSRCELRFVADPRHAPAKRYRVRPSSGPVPTPVQRLQNEWLDVTFSEQTGVSSFRFGGEEIGGADFLQPFVSYRTKKRAQVYPVTHWELLPLHEERWDGLSRVCLRADVPMQTPFGEFTSQFTYTFTLFDRLPHLYVDVEARYAATPPTETIHNMTQKLRRLMDLRWVEVAPFQLHPSLQAPAAQPLRVWKHNYLGVTSYYDLNYGQINPRNRDLDSFNHQVTAGWVAVSDGKYGLLLGENAEALASMAFCPMRLRERGGVQAIWLNPFGSYYGRQFDSSHLGAKGIGAEVLMAFSGALKPNGPAYNGQTLHFSLLLAPYRGDKPPAALQAEAAAHFYPPGTVYHVTPEETQALLPKDLRAQAEDRLRQAAIAGLETLPAPGAFLANPSHGEAHLVWDPPRDLPVSGYEVAWRAAEESDWQVEALPPANRHVIAGLQDGKEYIFKVRAVCGSKHSEWTPESSAASASVSASGMAELQRVPVWSLLRLAFASLVAVVRARLAYRRNVSPSK